MISIKPKRILCACCVLGSAIILGCTSSLVYAEPSSEELEATTSSLQGELNDLYSQLGALSGEVDSLSQQIADSEARMADIEARMAEAQAKGEEQYEAMKLRIKHMYEAGEYNYIELLCTSENMADFLNKTDYIKTVSEYDRDMLQALRDTQDEIKEEGEALQAEQENLLALKESLSAKCADINSRINSTAEDLTQYADLLSKVKAAEQVAQSSNSTGTADSTDTSAPTVSTPSQSTEGKRSIGTFRISHYCPCYYCCGAWGSATASGTMPTVGRTIAVDPRVIPLGSRVIINGNVYVAEDTGGSIKGNKIDIFVGSHSIALRNGVYYAEVYWAD